MGTQGEKDGAEWPLASAGMAARIRDHDWTNTPLGPIERWPQSLKTVVDIMLSSPGMMSLVWGEEAIHIYNDGFTELLREHSAQALGKSAFETFARSRDVFATDVAAGMAGKSARLPAQRYPVLRDGRLQDAWFDVDYLPVRNDAGAVAGVLWTLKETTQQVLAERALRESEARHRLLVESWAQAIWETDADGVVVKDSPSWRAYTGQTLEEWLGYGWLDAVHPDDRAYAKRQWRESVAIRGAFDAEYRLRAPDGSWRWTNVRATPVLDAAGSIERWVGINIDVDARKRAEAALRESEDRLRRFGEASQDILWMRDAQTLERTYLTPAFARIYGMTREEGLERAGFDDWMALIAPEDRALVRDMTTRVLAGEEVSFEYRIRRPDNGELRWLRNNDFPIRDEHGRVTSFGGIGQDITSLKVIEENLRASEERLRSAAEVAKFALWDWDIPTDTVAWSDEHYRMEGLEVGEVEPSYESWAARVHPDDRPATEAAILAARDSRTEYMREFRSLHSDGSVHWHQARGRFFYAEDGTPVRMIGAMLDTTERRGGEERQKILLAELQHRVRNILAVIRSIISRSNDGQRSTEDYVQHLQGRISALARTQVLLTRRINAGIDLGSLIYDELVVQAAQEAQFSLDGPDVELSPKAAEVLTLAIHELATNATKYGAFAHATGKLHVEWVVEVREGQDWLLVDWTETGVPIVEPVPRRQGFGSELISRRIPYELKGEASFEFRPGGFRSRIEFPLCPGDSILQTNGVQQ